MKLSSKHLAGVLFAVTLGMVSVTAAVAATSKKSPWTELSVAIPGFLFEYSIHSTLKPGYHPLPREVTVAELSSKQTSFRFGNSSHEVRLATYFYGVVGAFRDFDMTVTVSVIRLDEDQAAKSVPELRDWVQRVYSRKRLLKDGSELVEAGPVAVQKVGDVDLVVVESPDMYLFKEVELQGGAFAPLHPWRGYFIRLDDRMVVSLRMDHFTAKKVTPGWHQDTTALAEEMIRRMRFVPSAAKG